MKGGMDTYPVYCFWLGKTVVHVPTGGVLKRRTILGSAGERSFMMLESVVSLAGYWAAT